MAESRMQIGETERIAIQAVDSSSAGVTGATISLSIRRASDGFWWSGTVFQSAYTTSTMTETDSSNWPGMYHYDFFPPRTDMRLTLRATTATAGVANGPWVGELVVGYWVDNLDAALTSRASDTDMQEALKRIGSEILDVSVSKIRALLGQIISLVSK